MDNLSEIRAALLKAMQRQSSYFGAQRGIDLPTAVTAPFNLLGAGEPGFEGGFATGYDGSATTVPFTWGVSLWGDPDLWTGS